MQSNGELCESPEKQRRGMVFYVLGRDPCKQRVHWRKLKVQSVVTFHWWSYGRLSLAELFLGKEESFLAPAATLKYHHTLWEMQGTPCPVGVSGVCSVSHE